MKKIMIISHNNLNLSNANGRTILHVLGNLSRFDLFQISFSNNDSTILDKEKVFNFISTVYTKKNEDSFVFKYFKELKNSFIFYFIRNLVYFINFYFFSKIKNFINKIQPDIIFFQMSDQIFVIFLCLFLAKFWKIDVYILDTEDYYLKIKRKFILSKLFYWNFYKYFFVKLYKSAKFIVYSNDKLKDSYNKIFSNNFKSTVIYTYSSLKIGIKPIKTIKRIVYFGNIGVGRLNILNRIYIHLLKSHQNLEFDIYASIESNLKSKYDKINFKGFLNYDNFNKVLKNTDILFHAENPSNFYCKDLEHSFTTKLADYLMSGLPVIVFARNEIAISKFLISNSFSGYFSNIDKLVEYFDLILKNDYVFKKNLLDSERISREYFTYDANKDKFFNLINVTYENNFY